MSEYGELIQLENVDVDKQVVKIATENLLHHMKQQFLN